MSNKIDLLHHFGRRQQHTKPLLETNYVVTLSRVSSKKQFEETLSLENQDKYFEDHAARTGKVIVSKFGCTYESAKTDDRVEFKKMLEFVKQNNARSPKKISEIWVYTTDRFSRTGIGGMKIAEQLREKYGVAIFAITQPTSVKDESGILNQNMQFLFSNYENKLRTKRMIDGMTGKFRKGEWVTCLPRGYSAVKEGKVRTIVINEEGEMLRKAFIWKSEGMKDSKIIQKLKTLGFSISKQDLSRNFTKPFYCGLINHGLLDGDVVQGNHPKLISLDIFLKVNGIRENSANYGVPHEKEREELPLKVYVKCDRCKQPFTGYSRNKKTSLNLFVYYYYKCRTDGCKCNKRADDLHSLYVEELAKYAIKENLLTVVNYELENYFHEITKDRVEEEKQLKHQLTEVNKKIENIEEKYYVLNEMTAEVFKKFSSRFEDEKYKIVKLLEECSFSISNLQESIVEVTHFTDKINAGWTFSDISAKETLQNIIFPEGIYYDRENHSFRTPKVNFIFELIARQISNTDENGKATNHLTDDLSLAAEKEGFEPPDL